MCVKKSDNVNHQNNEGYSNLMLAIERCKVEIAKSLLKKKGANINHQNKYGDTALTLVSNMIDTKKFELMKLVLEKGANINHQNSEGNTALMLAIERREFEIVKLLLENGANVNHQNSEGNTALIIAAEKDNFEIVKFLLTKIEGKVIYKFPKGCVSKITKYKLNNFVLYNVITYGTELNYNVQSTTSDCHQDYNDVLLLLASYYGDKEIVDSSLKNGANVNTECVVFEVNNYEVNDSEINMIRSSPLMNAVDGDYLEIVELLVEYKANVNYTINGYTPLILAAKRNNDHILKYLIENGSCINYNKYRNPLIYALKNKNLVISDYLIDKGANPNCIDYDECGETALMLAIREKCLSTVEKLISKGAKVNLKDYDGYTALDHLNELKKSEESDEKDLKTYSVIEGMLKT